MTLSQLIDLIKDGRVSDAYYVYADEDLESLRSPDTQVYVEKAPTFDAENNEVLPDTVKGTRWEPFCSIQLIEDVILNAIKQQPSVTDAEIISAFDYYMQNDDFMEIEG